MSSQWKANSSKEFLILISSKCPSISHKKKNDENEFFSGKLWSLVIFTPLIANPDRAEYKAAGLSLIRDKPAALYSALSGFAINGVNMTKLQSFPEKNSFSSFFFLCDIDGHLDEIKIKNSLEELAFHCEDMHVLGVYKAHNFREKK